MCERDKTLGLSDIRNDSGPACGSAAEPLRTAREENLQCAKEAARVPSVVRELRQRRQQLVLERYALDEKLRMLDQLISLF